jgi:hypothetical protein
MQQQLKEVFRSEMQKTIHLYKKMNWTLHFIIPHTKSHWWMLKVGFRKGNFKEVFGQVTRIIASILFSKIWVPSGNTGGTDVNPFKSIPIPDDLKFFLKKKT